MSTAIGVPPGASTGGQDPHDPHRQPAPVLGKMAWKGVRALASLQLTVVLFALSMVLVFFGTLAQIDKGVWTVVEEYFRSWIVWVPFQLVAEFGKKFSPREIFEISESAIWPGSFPFPGGWLIGFVMLANLIAAHLTRFKLSWRRTGVIILHLGVILLMTGELITGLFAVESRMMLAEGESKNYIDHSRRIELAFTNSATHESAIIPQGMLSPGETITDAALPVDVEVLQKYKNTTLRHVSGGDDSNTVVAVTGGRYEVVQSTEESGVKSDQHEDIPGIRVRLLKKGTHEVLAERMFSLWEYQNGPASRQFMALPTTVAADGHTYTVELRNERIYKPYTITLLKFEHTNYVGTTTPKDFASTVQLVDPETGDDREVRIWMNHPLRHRGETFYQQSTLGSETAGGTKDTGTVLQVVKNPGWVLPYVSCIVITLGMLIHFGMGIAKFAGKLRNMSEQERSGYEAVGALGVGGILALVYFFSGKKRCAAARAAAPGPTWSVANIVPWAVIGVFAVYAVSLMMPRPMKYKDFDIKAFGSIPVVDGGRLKPLDSVARTTMLFISARSDWEDLDGKMQPASLWLLHVMAANGPSEARPSDTPIGEYRVFRVDNEQVLAEMDLPYRPGSYRYSYNEIRNGKTGDKFDRELFAAQSLEEKRTNGEKTPDDGKDLFHGKILELGRRLHAYEQLAFHKTPTLIPTETGSVQWRTLESVDTEAGRDCPPELINRLEDQLVMDLKAKGLNIENPRMQALVEMEATRRGRLQWGQQHRALVSPAAAAFGDILDAYKNNQPKAFAEKIRIYTTDYVYPLNAEFRDTTQFEEAFNGTALFVVCAVMYVFAAVLMANSWLWWTRPLWKSAMGVAAIALVIHAAGLLARMYIMGRPLVFVTNLYSTALLIGCAGVALSLVTELVFRNGLALVVGCVLGAVTAKAAHHMSTDGNDTMAMLQAVLDTNLWLASHVTTVNLGYMATYVSGLLGVAYIAWGLCFTTLYRERHIAVGNMIYGVTCFATLLSFVGTVLGGIWADQSWGRFWGWDPKENGAVLIVIWNALILHARWCGMVKQRGMAVLAVGGIIVTTWSYFGTNQLGVGLHSYGFSKTFADWCTYTWLTSLAIMGIGMIPLKYWRSFAPDGLPHDEPKPVSAPASVATQTSGKRATASKQAQPG